MQVQAILATKGDGVVSIAGNASILEAATLMTERKIGSVVVMGAEKRVIGIFTERDFMRMVAADASSALQRTVADVMTRGVMTCTGDVTVEEVMNVMTEKKFRHLPVVDRQGRLLGIISIGDAVKYRLQQAEREQEALRDYIQTA